MNLNERKGTDNKQKNNPPKLEDFICCPFVNYFVGPLWHTPLPDWFVAWFDLKA